MISHFAFDDGGKAARRFLLHEVARYIITQSKVFAREDIERVSKSAQPYTYIILTFQVQARSSIVVF